MASCSADGLTGLTSDVATASLVALVDPDRRQDDDRRLSTRGGGPDRGRQRDAIELGHVQVRDDQIEPLPASHPAERLARRTGVASRHAPPLDQRSQDPPIRGVVVDDQDVAASHVNEPHRRDRDLVGRRVRLERQLEGAPSAGDAIARGDDRAVHKLGKAPADRQAEARPSVATRDRRIRLTERLEQA